MTWRKREIMDMAREAGLVIQDKINGGTMVSHIGIEPFAALVAEKATAREREACAKVCEELVIEVVGNSALAITQCATAIRARGNT